MAETPGAALDTVHVGNCSRAGCAKNVLYSVNLVDPLDQELHGTLGDMLLEAERAQEALTEYSIALALNPHDKATANYRMASAHHQLGNDEQSQDHLLQALDLAPNFRPAQKLLLDLMMAEVLTPDMIFRAASGSSTRQSR